MLSFSLIPALNTASSISEHQQAVSGSPANSSTISNTFYTSGLPSTGKVINPTQAYSSEPAPMGIADFGLSSSSTAYEYNTTSFLGTVMLNGMSSSTSGGDNASSLQLNLNLNFTSRGVSYDYWVQNVAVVNTTLTGANQRVIFIDNVWNFTSNTLSSSTLQGNGTVASYGTGNYYYFVAPNLPGNNVTLSSPYKIQMKEISTINSAGVPEAIMQYNDGYGWVTYDNINFTFASSSLHDNNFVVEGFKQTPLGPYEDAEMILGGPGGGSSSQYLGGNIAFMLQYWNGHNFQFVPNAYNFGADTGETSYNVGVSLGTSVSNASLFSNISTGSSSLGQLYSLSSMSVLNISLSQFPSGKAYINGAQYNYTGGDLNLTLFPGTYNVTIFPSGTGKQLKGTFDLKAGSSFSANSTYFARKYDVNFTTQGIPSGIGWNITFQNGTVVNSNASELQLHLSNGTYSLYVNSSGHYTYNGTSLVFTIDGSNATIFVNFSKEYAIHFMETGLHGIVWFLNFSGQTMSHIGSNITIYAINGTYNYSVMHLNGYYSVPTRGTVSVNGSQSNVSITFQPKLYNVTIVANGIPDGYYWAVYVNGVWYNSSNSTVNLQVPNGSYIFEVNTTNGAYVMQGTNHTLSVAGGNLTVNLQFRNQFNSGVYLEDKAIYAAILVILAASGLLLLRRK